MDKAGAKIRDRGNLDGAAVRAHGESEAERIIRIVGAEMELPESVAELELLRKGNPRKVMRRTQGSWQAELRSLTRPRTELFV